VRLRVATLALLAALGGCAIAPLSAPQPNLESIQAIGAAGLAPLAVGAFSAAPGRPTEMDHTIHARADFDHAPDGSFAKYLGDTLAAQLHAAGRLDPASPCVVSGVITDAGLVTQQAMSEGRLAARFTVTRGGRVVFEKTFSVSDRWNSDYLAAVAVPDAFNHYAGFFPKLVGELLADRDFQAVARKGA
jgi:hypothetical protein